jgi:hypothetical protein
MSVLSAEQMYLDMSLSRSMNFSILRTRKFGIVFETVRHEQFSTQRQIYRK